MSTAESPRAAAAPPICGIGASAGGVEALQQFFTGLRADLGLAYVVIVHLAPDRKSELPALLGRWTEMPVLQVGDHLKVPLAADHVYVIAPDRKLEITDSAVGASAFEQPRGQRTAIDLFFRSLAAAHADSFAVVLSGTGSDGALGARAIKAGGGAVLVQAPLDAAYPDMPRAVIATGAADVVLPVRDLPGRLAEIVGSRTTLGRAATTGKLNDDDTAALAAVLDHLRKRTGHDFSKYKRATVLRRLARRMQLTHQATLTDYLRYQRGDAAEVQALLDDLLISVTAFFRDPEAWAALQSTVIAPLVEQAGVDDPVRAWVPGCATGEEAFTLAMLFQEEFERRQRPSRLIVFASDLDESALAVGREGLYPRAIADDVGEERLKRFFRAEDDHYRVLPALRDQVVFACHSVLRDPPFSRLHLVSCRNVLIYLDRDLQEQVMGVFRYALRDEGYLFLGSSEVSDNATFATLDKKQRIYAAKPRSEGDRRVLPEILAAPLTGGVRLGRDARIVRSVPVEQHTAALEAAAPPSVLVDERWGVVHVSGTASRYFQQGGGPLARRVTDLVRAELRDELHAVLHRATESGDTQLSAFVPVAFDGGATRRLAILTQPVASAAAPGHFLVTFLDAGPTTITATVDRDPGSDEVRALREKLRQAEQRIESIRDDHHVANEDLRAANEELQSLNEEYRSTTEELETSKEELQSINEELQTVNLELKLKLEEISHAHNDLENLMAATEVPTLFLGSDLRIKRFTPQLDDIFNVRSRDVGRPISDLTHVLDYDGLAADAHHVLATVTAVQREVRSHDDRTFIVRLNPYRTAEVPAVGGVVVTFIDVTASKATETALRDSERHLEAELHAMHRLHRLTLDLATASVPDALQGVLDAAIELHHADAGHVQLADEASHGFRVVAQRGFDDGYLRRYGNLGGDDDSRCGSALRSRRPCQVRDTEVDTTATRRDAAVAGGYRAMQAVPLVDRDEVLVGILSVHFREPREFSERDTQIGELLAGHAASLVATRTHQDRVARLNEMLRMRSVELEASQERLARHTAELLEESRHREEFLAALGHELRNPVAAIHSSLSVLEVTGERSERALAVFTRQVTHLTRLINDLLDVTRVNQGRLRLDRSPVDLASCIRAAMEAVKPQADAKDLALVEHMPAAAVVVEADQERLTQVLDNLLRNAITYTDVGEVTVAVEAVGPMAVVTVSDTGIGIDGQHHAKIFSPQQRDLKRRGGGLGLGLTVVKGLVEAHGGSVTFKSDGRGRGTEFSFTIPLAQRAAAPAPAPAASVARAHRVLVVDDQRDVADMFAALLEAMGQSVRIAYSGADALAAARTHQPRIAFVDISMPDMGGAELARRLRAEFDEDALMLVAVTGFDTSHREMANAPFDQHMLKPASIETVATLLNSLAVTST
jgi:two-component system CheB/CheR fusion protein